jgi:divalent metal cation (Fe/Co/Zn/Cd) transporter
LFFAYGLAASLIKITFLREQMMGKALSPRQKEWRRKWVVFFSAIESLVESGIKLGAALITGSIGLLADAIHSAADVAGSFMVWIGVRLATRKFKRFPYGFYKIENLLALFIGFAILYGAYEIFKGPGLMFYRFGIDVRKTEEENLDTLLQDYFSRSESAFPRKTIKR